MRDKCFENAHGRQQSFWSHRRDRMLKENCNRVRYFSKTILRVRINEAFLELSDSCCFHRWKPRGLQESHVKNDANYRNPECFRGARTLLSPTKLRKLSFPECLLVLTPLPQSTSLWWGLSISYMSWSSCIFSDEASDGSSGSEFMVMTLAREGASV